MVCQGISPAIWLNITAAWHTLWRENGPVLVNLGVCSPQKWSYILIITCWFNSVPLFSYMFLHGPTFPPWSYHGKPPCFFAAQLRVICSGPVLLDLHRSRVCIRSQGSWFATSWSTTCVCPRPSDFLKSGEKSEAMSKNGGIWRYT